MSRNEYSRFNDGVIRRFEKTDIMPTLSVQNRKTRFLLPDIITVNEEGIEWQLLGKGISKLLSW